MDQDDIFHLEWCGLPTQGTKVWDRLDEYEGERGTDRQAAVSSRVSPANQLARLPWLTTFPRNVNCSFLPFNHQHHRQPHRPWPHTNAASQIPSSLSPPEGPSRVSPVCVCSSSAPLQTRPSKRDFFFSPQTPVMALGACFPPLVKRLAGSVTIRCSPHRYDSPLHPRLACFSSNPYLTDAAMGLGLTLQKDSPYFFLVPIPVRAPDKPHMPNVIIAPVAVRDALCPDQSYR